MGGMNPENDGQVRNREAENQAAEIVERALGSGDLDLFAANLLAASKRHPTLRENSGVKMRDIGRADAQHDRATGVLMHQLRERRADVLKILLRLGRDQQRHSAGAEHSGFLFRLRQIDPQVRELLEYGFGLDVFGGIGGHYGTLQ